MEAHGEDLRGLVDDDALVDAIKRDFRQATLPARTHAMLEYAEKLTLTPSKMRREDVDALRVEGLTDEQVLDVVEIAAYFNYINRIADALHVDVEEGMPAYPHQSTDG